MSHCSIWARPPTGANKNVRKISRCHSLGKKKNAIRYEIRTYGLIEGKIHKYHGGHATTMGSRMGGRRRAEERFGTPAFKMTYCSTFEECEPWLDRLHKHSDPEIYSMVAFQKRWYR